MAKSRITVGSSRASATILGADTLADRAIRHATKAAREPMEGAMRVLYAGVKREWPRPTKQNRTGNKRRAGKGFNDPGWTSTGNSLKRWRWSTRVNVRIGSVQGIPNATGTITVSLTNDSMRRGGRYAFMARYPFPNNRKFYWRELALKPARKMGRKMIRDMANEMAKKLKGGR